MVKSELGEVPALPEDVAFEHNVCSLFLAKNMDAVFSGLSGSVIGERDFSVSAPSTIF